MTTTVAATSRWRRHGATLVIVGAFLLAVIVAALLGSGGEGRTARYDPDNAGPNGAQALARVLDNQGIDVTVVRSADELDRTSADRDTVVVVTSTEDLGQTTVDRLLKHVRGSHLILVDPGPKLAGVAGLSAQVTRGTVTKGLAAACANPLAKGLTLEVDSALFYSGDDGCFADDQDNSVLQERGEVTLFGGGQAMTNDQILRGANAAVSLRLLGQGERVIWYVPRFEDLTAGDQFGVGALLPRWIKPGLWLAGIAVIFLILWRARRLGPLATEPLPVVVKAIETTLSRGRMYRKAKDRSHAATTLRSAARARLTHQLGLPASHDQDALIRQLANHLGRPVTEISALVRSDAEAPPSDRDLMQLARDLKELDREARIT